VPSPDDERFEQYLKGFRPIAPPSLPLKGSGWTSRPAVVVATLAVAAAVLIVAALMLRSLPEPNQSSQREQGPVAVEQLTTSQPLTIQSANAMLAQAPSAKAAIDSIAFQSQKTSLSQGHRSALAELSKETNKL
jgi:negative regulator of sigma E activity